MQQSQIPLREFLFFKTLPFLHHHAGNVMFTEHKMNKMNFNLWTNYSWAGNSYSLSTKLSSLPVCVSVSVLTVLSRTGLIDGGRRWRWVCTGGRRLVLRLLLVDFGHCWRIWWKLAENFPAGAPMRTETHTLTWIFQHGRTSHAIITSLIIAVTVLTSSHR